MIHPHDRKAVWDGVQQALAKRCRFQLEYRIRTAQGEEKWVWEQGVGVFSETGELQALEGFITDINDRKRTEAHLQELNNRLDQLVTERTAELTAANQWLEAEVAQRRQAEQDLAIFERFVDAATQGFGMADADGRILYANPYMARLLGRQRPEDVIGKHVSNYYPADYLRRREREILPALRRGEPWQGEQVLAFPDGQMHPTIHTIFPVQDDDGKLACTAVVITDITDLRRAEDALRQSYEELQTIYDCMVDGLLIADIETKRFAKANRAICQMLGYSPEEVLSMSVQDIHPPGALPAVLTAFQSQAEGHFLRAGDLPTLRRHGSIFYADVIANRIVYNGRPCLIGVFRDVTERRRAEEELRASQERFELAVRGSGVGIWDWDLITGKVYYSVRWKSLFGYDENEIGEGFDDWASRLHPDDREWIIKAQDDFLADPLSTATAEYRLRHKDGSYRWIIAHVLAVRDEQGKATRLVGSHGDITDRKLAEEKVRAQQQSLRRMLQASDHDREMITFEIHDGVAQRLLGALLQFEAYDRQAEHESERLKAVFEAGLQALREASAEARSLMNRTRTPVLQKFGIKAALADFIDNISERPNAPEITYRCEVEFRRLAPIIENAIFRVAQEAITNAFLHSKSELVRVSLVQDGEEVTLEVQDYGIGFDRATVAKGRFGLDGMRERARSFGKELELDSRPGQGTRIRATFPVIQPDEQEMRTPGNLGTL